jgi:flagellar hook protein FlgE
MSINGALYSAVSGLSADSQAISMISNNIANANTTGFKETSALFQTLVTEAPTAASFQPGGVIAQPFSAVTQQGLLQATSVGTDLAISGNGFFAVNSQANSQGSATFTRDGSFTVDASGNLKNDDGVFLQGQKLTAAEATAVANGNVNQLTATGLTSLTTVNVSALAGTAKATANITLAANLPASDTSTSAAHTITVPVFDSQGASHDLSLTLSRVPSKENFTITDGAAGPVTGDAFTLTLEGQTFTTQPLAAAAPTNTDILNAVNTALQGTTFTATLAGNTLTVTDTIGNPMTGADTIAKSAGAGTETVSAAAVSALSPAQANTWQVAASVAGGTLTPLVPGTNDRVVFNANGTLNPATTFKSLTVASWTGSGAAGGQVLNFNLGTAGQSNGLTQLGSTFSVAQVNQDGLSAGNFTGVSIDPNGIVTANFDNGLQQAIYIVPVATFAAPDALAAASGNNYVQTQDSGNVLLQQAGVGGAGQIDASSLENSTVDIAQEFSNLIITQRAYEANAKMITTADQMLETLIQAKQ